MNLDPCVLVLDDVRVPQPLQDMHLSQQPLEPLLVIAHGDLLHRILPQRDSLDLVLAQEHRSAGTTPELPALLEELLVVALVEGGRGDIFVSRLGVSLVLSEPAGEEFEILSVTAVVSTVIKGSLTQTTDAFTSVNLLGQFQFGDVT